MAGGRGSGRRYALSALLAGVVAIGLVVLGWWVRGWAYRADRDRFLDPEWWVGFAASALGHLAFGRAGFKVALLVVGLTIAAWVGLRRRRPRAAEPDDQPPAETAE
ncbi:hypothetical protein D7147_23440 [Micromonospora musae]|uniref:Uncharacterized protein n=1 Tax=Micromonospora musae TaxID=1894970 RepID=A0A3A9YLV1_9ACTN|nr:hypothetical protein [Micromonospora musae]RKN16057.1 hypothetical protein D7147_23440 [Micromonospora musae]RKN35377.1 hypothetical protein D7044_04185 [Micromonospora musae]